MSKKTATRFERPSTAKLPSLKRRRDDGRAYAYFDWQQVTFGPYDDPATHLAFARLLERWRKHGDLGTDPEVGPSLADLVASYLRHAEIYYRRDDGSLTQEPAQIGFAVRPLLQLYANLPAKEIDLAALKATRERMIESDLARKTIKDRIGRIVRMFGWAAEEQLVPATVYHELRALSPLKAHRSTARETEPILPVEWAHVEAALAHLTQTVASMVLLQWYTGMRPDEVRQMCPCDIDRSQADCWIYRPFRHKTKHRGKERRIHCGPKAQEVLRPHLDCVPTPDPEEPLFSPRHAVAERQLRAAQARKHPARHKPRKRNPQVQPGSTYTNSSYRLP